MFAGAKQTAREKVPSSVRLFTPEAEGRPSEVSIASSTAMLAEPPGPQPVTPGAVKVVSVAEAFSILRTPVSGWILGCGSRSTTSVPVSEGLVTTGLSSEPMKQELPSSGLINWNFTGCVHEVSAKFVMSPADVAKAYSFRYLPP